MADIAARLRRVDHTWPSSGVQACRNVSLELIGGDIHALVGENGAGKTTLGHILAGVRVPDSGILQTKNAEQNLAERRGHILEGIGLVRQHCIWPKELKIWEAATLGRKNAPNRRKETLELFRETAEAWGIADLDPLLPVARLNAAMLQRAELTAALMFNPKILILDEPASAWEEGREEEFRGLMKTVKQRGLSLLLITHRIDDVFRFADTVTVMRHGIIQNSWPTQRINREQVLSGMFGESGFSELEDRPGNPATGSTRQTCLEVKTLGLKISGRRVLENISFKVVSGEVLSITGLREEGLADLEDAVTGNSRPDTGKILINGKNPGSTPSALRQAGLRYIPSDKTGRGASLESTMAENMLVLNSRRISRKGILKPTKMNRWADARRRDGGIDGSPEQKLGELSGGNIQKVILEREFHGEVPVIVAADPTWGLDERSRQSVHRRIRKNANEGAAVLLLASDLDEALENGDRLAVISSGVLSAAKPVDKWSRDEITNLMASGGAGS